MKKTFLIILLFLTVALFATDKITRPIFIIDGDTFIGLNSEIFRLWGVDAPELDQKWGITARAALIELIHKKRVTTTKKGTSYSRTVATVEVYGKDVGLELIKMGLAWHVPKYAPDNKEYAQAMAEAKKAKRGLWSSSAVSPATHRETRAE